MQVYRLILLAIALAMLAAGPVNAKPGCTLISSGLSFGFFNPVGSGFVDITGTLTLSCDPGQYSYQIALSTGSSKTYRQRLLKKGSDEIPYQLYIDNARTVAWGDGSGGSSTVVGQLSEQQSTITLTVYGRVFGNPSAPVGFYTDNIVATGTY